MDDNVSDCSDSASSSSSTVLAIKKKIESLQLDAYSLASGTEVDSVQPELSLSTLENLTYEALEINFKLRMQLLLCERRLVLLKMRPLKKESSSKEVPKRDSMRGFLSQFMAPYFKDKKGHGCWACNDSSPHSIFQCFHGTSKPAKNDYFRVAEAVKEYLVKEISSKYNFGALNSKITLTEGKEQALSLAIREIRLADDVIRADKKKNVWQLLGSDLDRELDWTKIAAQETVHGLSASECQGIWNIVLKPRYKFRKWMKQRPEMLKELAIRYRFQCWEDIAHHIGRGMTGFVAFTHFLTNYDHLLGTNGAWSKEEDNHLLRVIKACTIGKEILWGKVIYYVEDRTMQQCITRSYKINPAMKRGNFTKNEDALLLYCVDKFGCDFVKIASVFGNRSVIQLRGRFQVLKIYKDSDQNTGEWSIEEDRILLALVEKYGESKWSQIANEMPSRNRVQIRQRYSSVLKKKLIENPVLDLKSLQRVKRYAGAPISEKSIKSSWTDENITIFVKEKVAGGKITVRAPVHRGRKSKEGIS